MGKLLSQAELNTGSWMLYDVIALTHGKNPENMSDEEQSELVERQALRFKTEGEETDREFALGPVPQKIPSVVEHLGPITMIGLFERVEPS